MCFYDDNDYEWYASIHEKEETIASESRNCDECSNLILPGDFLFHVFQQEHEDCQRCELLDCSCKKGKCCQCEEPDFGHDYNYYRCESCHKFLKAIHDVEIEAGCPEHASQPSYGGLKEEIYEIGIQEKRRYFKKALQMYPEIRGHLKHFV